ncbi:uncharacterized protein LOC126672908 [Mercurialis annua]|uniref:uncharacterized protein LOC126672908 n=1 Tax=Mercurialis annua TaxID=3986 RepID=UPI002160E5A4|nr:uncharacterized protein LOC126672908 [Mercurialis annua]
MANRMKSLTPLIISEKQSAFIKNRLITDNFLVAFKIGHYLKRKRRGRNGMPVLKFDISKANDRVGWNFVEKMMLSLGFSRRWVDLIMVCISTVRYTSIGDYFEMDHIFPNRGLRQGDLLFPYLFIICAEASVEEISVLKRCWTTRNWHLVKK